MMENEKSKCCGAPLIVHNVDVPMLHGWAPLVSRKWWSCSECNEDAFKTWQEDCDAGMKSNSLRGWKELAEFDRLRQYKEEGKR